MNDTRVTSTVSAIAGVLAVAALLVAVISAFPGSDQSANDSGGSTSYGQGPSAQR